jgi:zinc transport system substrate-binding protein
MPFPIMEGVAVPDLIVSGSHSLHNYQPKPSDAKRIHQAQILFYVDNELEFFLPRFFSGMSEDAIAVNLGRTSAIELLPIRTGKQWDRHAHHAHDLHKDNNKDKHHDHKDSQHEVSTDWHIWLNPDNAIKLGLKVSEVLSEHDPENSERYESNFMKLKARIQLIDQQISELLKDAEGIPFIVFHDAYQYFEQAYSLNAVGTVLLDPSLPPTAKQLYLVRSKIDELKPACLFSEPGINTRVLKTVLEGNSLASIEMDPEGISLTPGASLYFELVTLLAENVRTCLVKSKEK